MDETLQGWINLYKPKNISSFFAIKKIQSKFQIKKIGHCGTLDPLAEGILPIAIGKTTKLIPFVIKKEKKYIFTIKWGKQTSTDDLEGIVIHSSNCIPSKEAIELSERTDKDPRLVELILRESKKVVRSRKGIIIVEHNLGFVHANAGIDRSNIDSDKENPKVLLLPKNPDKSALKLKNDLSRLLNKSVGVIINDSTGRAWRNGIVGIAIGSSGVSVLYDLRGKKDLYGGVLEITEVGIADEIASAASLLMGQADEGQPVILVHGLRLSSDQGGAKSLLRSEKDDLFR